MAARKHKEEDAELLPDAGDNQKPLWFDTNKGNLLQFIGILLLTTGLPLVLFGNTRTLGYIFCPLGVAFYAVGRFANWYFWYRLQ